MKRTEAEIIEIVRHLLDDTETELVEFKEAKQSFNLDKLGRYFSALSNEANLRNAECGWLVFGITDKRAVCGTAYCKEQEKPSVGLRKLKHDIATQTNGSMTFEEIYEIELDGKRVIVFQIPAAPFATPTTWRGIPWSREHESLKEMPLFKIDAIAKQSRPDWSRQIAYEATLADLDNEAIEFACAQFVDKFNKSQPALKELSPADLLKKMGLLIHDHITNAALVLLGKPESSVFLGSVEPRITWTLYSSSGDTVAYQHFEPPFILQVDKVLGKIRNERYRYFTDEETLFPTEVERYSTEVIRELLNNAIAHQDYRNSGKINVLEYEDKLTFKNEGSFIPGSIDVAIESGYKPPYYRNDLLAKAMSKTNMIDQNAIGIRSVFGIQKSRYLPLPTYDLSLPKRVSVTVYGTVINKDYSRLLAAEPSLELQSVVLLDLVQKGQQITKAQAKYLHDQGLVEGRYPRLRISSKVATATGKRRQYLRDKGLDNSICKELIIQYVSSQPASRVEITNAIEHALPRSLTEDQKSKKVSNLLQQLRKEGRIVPEGKTAATVWSAVQ